MRGRAPHHFDVARTPGGAAARSTAISASDILERLPYGAGTLVTRNSAGRELLGELADGFERQEATCCRAGASARSRDRDAAQALARVSYPVVLDLAREPNGPNANIQRHGGP